MKKINLLVSLAFLIHFSCASDGYQKIKVEISSASKVNLSSYKEVLVTNFFLKKEIEGFDLSKELQDFFIEELGFQYQGTLVPAEVTFANEETFSDKSFWIKTSEEHKEALLLTGKSDFSFETRKALLENERGFREYELSPEKNWAERKVFTLIITLYLIHPENGEILYEKEFKETKNYTNTKQPPDFAFFDLVQRVRQLFFREIFGGKRIQERYLLK